MLRYEAGSGLRSPMGGSGGRLLRWRAGWPWPGRGCRPGRRRGAERSHAAPSCRAANPCCLRPTGAAARRCRLGRGSVC
eukprot:10972150-Lingulodinium_polyedra.AAC.1